MDGIVLARPIASKRHQRLVRLLANALDDAAGPDWNADTGVGIRLRDVPLDHRRPAVTIYRSETIDISPTRPEHVLLVVETTERIVAADQYARAVIPFYWQVEQAAAGAPIVHTYVLDPATGRYRDGEIGTGAVTLTTPFAVEVDLGRI